MRLLLALLLMFPMLAAGAVRELTECGTLPETISAESPFDLDACNLQDGDDITSLLTDIATEWGNVYVRAPGKTVWVYAGYTVFTVDDFYFLEDQSARNTFLIQHKVVNPATCSGNDCYGYWVLWSFSNFDNVVIGGPKLSVTFVGNHPGLANCTAQYRPHVEVGKSGVASNCDTNVGLVEFRISDSSIPDLFDFRANVKFSQHYGLYSYNSTVGVPTNANNRVAQTNIAGLFYATSGVFLHQGTYDVWTDPDRFVVSDPFVRGFGWDGTVPDQSGANTPLIEQGLPVGCGNFDDDQVRSVGLSAYYSNSIDGGMLIEHGWHGFAQRYPGRIGTAESPYLVRIRNWAITGAGTGYPSGVRVKGAPEAIFSKGDPANNDPDTGLYRFVRLIALPSVGHGRASSSLLNCAQDNNWPNGLSNFMRFENGNTSVPMRWFQWEFAGDFDTNFRRGELVSFGSASDDQPNYGHTVRLAAGVVMRSTETTILRDRSTVTGPGTWANLAVTDASTAVQGKDSNIVNTNVSGTITVSANT